LLHPEGFIAFGQDTKHEEDLSMKLVRLLPIMVLLLLSSYGPGDVWAGGYESSFRCGTDVIILGNSSYRVLAKCGQPDARESIGTNYLYGMPAGEFRDVEQWIYNRGPTDFIYTLQFQGGSLTEIYRGGRGF
jgi:hypothetical protein